jgi:hydroxymethylglutaryl-CoA lyase
MGVSASETHSRKNTGMTCAEATDRILAMARQATQAQKKVQISVQSAFGCGYEGAVPTARVLQFVHRFLEAGFTNISLADTAGHATPDYVERLFEAVFKLNPASECTCHFHNTYGLGLASCFAALRAGVKYFESSVAGLGGCPFTKVAGGNVCTEDWIHYLQRIGRRHDINLEKLIQVAQDVSQFFSREMPGMIYKVGPLTSAIQNA